MLLMVYMKQHMKWLGNVNINLSVSLEFQLVSVLYDVFPTMSVENLLHDFFKSHTANIVTVNAC